eukprot:jgi/Tetstr1/427284/TSEL_001737.t1
MASRRPRPQDAAPADQPPPSWKRSLARHASAPSKAFGSRKFVLDKTPSFPTVKETPKPAEEEKSVRELLQSIPSLTVPPAQDTTDALAQEGSGVQQRAQDQERLAAKIQQARDEAAAYLEGQLKVLTLQQQRAFYEELQAARQLEHSQARAQLNAFRHQDALVLQELVSKAEKEKQAVMQQLEGVVKHERAQITSMESEIKLLREALKKAEGMSSAPLNSEGRDSPRQHRNLDSIADLVGHHHRSLSHELESMSFSKGGAKSPLGKWDGSAPAGHADEPGSAAAWADANIARPVHLQSNLAAAGVPAQEQSWPPEAADDPFACLAASAIVTQGSHTECPPPGPPMGKAGCPRDDSAWDPFSGGMQPPSEKVSTQPIAPSGGSGLGGGSNPLLDGAFSEANPFASFGGPGESQLGMEQLWSQVTTPEKEEGDSPSPQPDPFADLLHPAGSRLSSISRQQSDNPFLSESTGNWAADIPVPPAVEPAPQEAAPSCFDSLCHAQSAPNPFLVAASELPVPGHDAHVEVAAKDNAAADVDFASLFGDVAGTVESVPVPANASRPEAPLGHTSSGGNSGPFDVLDVSLTSVNGSDLSRSDSSMLDSSLSAICAQPAPGPKHNAMFEDEFTKLFEERHIARKADDPGAASCVEIKVNCLVEGLSLGGRREGPAGGGAGNKEEYVPRGVPMRSLAELQLDGLRSVDGLF